MSSFFPWMGGKRLLVPVLLRAIPPHTCYIEVFAGAANLLFAKPPSRVEVLNDLDGDLVNLFRVVKYHRREFLRTLAFLLTSRQQFKSALLFPGETDIQRAASAYFHLKASFASRGQTFGYGTTKGPSAFGPVSLANLRFARRRLAGVYIEQLDFAEILSRYDRPGTFFYCDPPYWQTAGYKIPFPWSDHQRLAARLAKIKGRFLLSINDHPDIRKLYKGFSQRKVSTRYTVSRDKRAAGKARPELLIANYPLPRNL